MLGRETFYKLFLGLFLSILVILARQWAFGNLLFSVKEGENNFKEYVNFGGLSRSYIIHLPENYNPEKQTPVMFIFHGVSSNADYIMKNSDMNAVSDKNNFIVVYPNGTGLLSKYILSWNAGGCCNFVEPFGVDDLSFVSFILESLKTKYNIDEKKIFAAGHSNGAMMAYSLACNMSSVFAGVAPVAGTIMSAECEPEKPVSVIAFHNIKDNIVPYLGGSSDNWLVNMFELNFRSAEDSVSFWVKNNKCLKRTQETEEGIFVKKIYYECEENSEVVLFSIEENTHFWPGGKQVGPLVGSSKNNIKASEIIWNFFEKHYRM